MTVALICDGEFIPLAAYLSSAIPLATAAVLPYPEIVKEIEKEPLQIASPRRVKPKKSGSSWDGSWQNTR